MSRGLRVIEARLLPRGGSDALRQLALLGLAYYGYQLVRGMVAGHLAGALWNAERVIALERGLHVFVEPTVQAWASGSAAVVHALAWIYVDAQLVVSVSAIVFIYLFRSGSFCFVRNMCLVAMALALVGYAVMPTAPPRLLPEWGFVDSVAATTGISDHAGPVSAFVNPYAAVPSMHVCFALVLGWPLARLVRPWPLRVAWALYPLVVAFVVVATANHFLFDVVAGVATAGASALAAAWLGHARRPAWSFRPAGVEAS